MLKLRQVNLLNQRLNSTFRQSKNSNLKDLNMSILKWTIREIEIFRLKK